MIGRRLTGVVALGAAAWALTSSLPDLPAPVTNNAVATGHAGTTHTIYSALGVDASLRWSGITTAAAVWTSTSPTWRSLPPVPGPHGRLAATAQVVQGMLLVFGGYTVDSAAREVSLPDVNIYDPVRGAWQLGTPTPVAVDDAVSGVYRDSLVYLVSGWHDTDNVQLVQVYDVVHDSWSAATPIPGPGVFGHTGSLAGNTIVFVDGAVRQATGPKYALAGQTWIGTIDPHLPTAITWRAGPVHPGRPVYRAAAAACGRFVIIAGGTNNPYNYNGIGYDGTPSEPLRSVMAYDTRAGAWRTLAPLPQATMDHRGLALMGDTAVVVAGLRSGQRVTASTVTTSLGIC